jgi:ubiquinone biosynthesis protein
MLAAQSSPVSGFVFVVAVLALGFVVAYLLGISLQAAQPGHAVAFFTVVLGVPLIVAMIVIVAAEVLVPTGTGPGPLEVIRGVRSAMRGLRHGGR